MKQRWMPFVLAGIVCVVALILASANDTFSGETIEKWSIRGNTIAAYLLADFLLVLLTSAALYSRARKLLWPAVCSSLALAASIASIIYYFQQDPMLAGWSPPGTLLGLILRVGRIDTVLPLTVLLSIRFWGKFDRVRLIAIAGVLALLAWDLLNAAAAFYSVSWWSPPYSASSLLIGVTVFMLTWCAWCLAFRLVPPNRAPADAGRQIALTCPRCGIAITVPVGAGECSGCRLQFHITLEEGVCAKCKYPLRGLTGDRCPECGTAILPSPVGASAAQT